MSVMVPWAGKGWWVWCTHPPPPTYVATLSSFLPRPGLLENSEERLPWPMPALMLQGQSHALSLFTRAGGYGVPGLRGLTHSLLPSYR